MSLRRVSLLSGFAALALVVAGAAGPASATEYYRPHKPVVQINKAPTTQSATSTATAKRGDALSSASNDNLVIQDNTKLDFGKRSKQLNLAPTTQSATSTATAKHGDALSDASNSNTIIQNNFGGRFQKNFAPTHQTATSSATAVGGSAVSSASNSNVVSQGNVR
jgi:TolA-binding protein